MSEEKYKKWEAVFETDGEYTKRLYVHGGWLVKTVDWFDSNEDSDSSVSTSICFVPDPTHSWEINK